MLLLISLLSQITTFRVILACSFCVSDNANEIRSVIFSADSITYTLGILVPFLVFTGIVILVFKGGKKG